MGSKERDSFVDVAKGIGMLMIVRIHTEVFSTISCPYPIIAVPLFFFLSGFYDNTNKPFKEWFPQAFKRLFLVGVIWVLISFAYLSLLSFAKERTIHIYFSLKEPVIAGGVEWFLFALFFAKLGMWTIHKSRIPHWLVLCILIALGGTISRVNLPFLIDEGIGAIPFYYAGYILFPYIRKYLKWIKWPALLGFACMLAMPMSWFPIVLVPYRSFAYVMYPVFFLMLLSSFITILWLGLLLREQEWLAMFGRQTLGILVIHPLLCHTAAITLNRVCEVGSIVWIIFFLCVYIVICMVSYYLSIFINKYIPFILGNF